MNAESKSTINTVSVNQHKGKGKILAIDKKAQKIKLAHGPIKSLNWGAMKMFFAVENKDLVDEVKVGDTVNFSFIKSNDGRFIIVDMN
ncbi:cation transporter [Alteromonas sp. MB-3u-76]|nr:cation transporter [Alteromonas sp. MB-3u-76]